MAVKIQGTNSAAAPAVSNDGNDGLVVGTDTIDLSIGGAAKFKVGAAGQLGIGGATYGTSGQVLTSGGASAAPSWAAAPAKIVQFKQYSYSTEVTGNSGTPNTGLGGSIAKTDASNKILMIASHEVASNTGPSEDKHGCAMEAQKSTDATGLDDGTWENVSQEAGGSIYKGPKFDNTNDGHWHAETACLIWYDFEDTTSTVWYKTVIGRWTGSTSYWWAQPDGRTSYLYLLEVDD